MLCNHECFVIGGPWIAENPSCPIHGINAQQRERTADDIIHMVDTGAMTYKEGYYAFAKLYGN